MKFLNIILVALFLWASVRVSAQTDTEHDIDITVPEVALLGLIGENETGVNFSTASPKEAGNVFDVSSASDESLWINYSSVIKSQAHKRKVIAVLEGKMPAGMHLSVKASEAKGNGKGLLGKPAGKVQLSNQPTDVILDIGSCYTGKGISNGHYLTYQLEYDESDAHFGELSGGQASVNVIYTLTDSN